MASFIPLKKATTTLNLFNKFFNLIRSFTSSFTRSFNSNPQLLDNVNNSDDIDRRLDQLQVTCCFGLAPTFFPDWFDPLSRTRSLNQVQNIMDQVTDRGVGTGLKRGYDIKDDSNGLYLSMDMPGVGKEDVKVSVEKNTLMIKGEGKKEAGEEDESKRRRYSSRIDLPEHVFKFDEIKAEMKNGVLKVVVPKLKDEERKDVFQVKVE